jgi:hypothetical protein
LARFVAAVSDRRDAVHANVVGGQRPPLQLRSGSLRLLPKDCLADHEADECADDSP